MSKSTQLRRHYVTLSAEAPDLLYSLAADKQWDDLAEMIAGSGWIESHLRNLLEMLQHADWCDVKNMMLSSQMAQLLCSPDGQRAVVHVIQRDISLLRDIDLPTKAGRSLGSACIRCARQQLNECVRDLMTAGFVLTVCVRIHIPRPKSTPYAPSTHPNN